MCSFCTYEHFAEVSGPSGTMSLQARIANNMGIVERTIFFTVTV